MQQNVPPPGTPAPPGYELRTDPNTNAYYYVNQATGQSQWTYPVTQQPYPAQGMPPQGAPATATPYQQPNAPPQQMVDPNAQNAGGMISNDPLSGMFNNVKNAQWMPTPQGVECSVPGLEKLTVVNKLIVKQDLSVIEAVSQGCCEFNNKYRLFNENGQLVYQVIEESDVLCRCCCNPNHKLNLEVKDEYDRKVMDIYRPFKVPRCCPVCLPCCQQQATIATGGYDNDLKVKGMLWQPCCGGFFTPKLELYEGTTVDADGGVEDKGTLNGIVTGPTCCIGGICCDSEFRLTGEDTDAAPWATITKEGAKDFTSLAKELLTDADNFTMEFTEGTSVEQKANALAANMLLDFMFFEDEGSFECGVTDKGNPECSIKCFDFYCCGCLVPCTCSCGGDPPEEDEDGGDYEDGGGDYAEEPVDEEPPADPEEPEEDFDGGDEM